MMILHVNHVRISLDAWTAADHTGGMTTTALWTTIRDELRERREAREALRKLRADLEHYRTPAEIDDLLASVDEEDTPEAELIRGILSENLRAYHSRQAVSA